MVSKSPAFKFLLKEAVDKVFALSYYEVNVDIHMLIDTI